MELDGLNETTVPDPNNNKVNTCEKCKRTEIKRFVMGLIKRGDFNWCQKCREMTFAQNQSVAETLNRPAQPSKQETNMPARNYAHVGTQTTNPTISDLDCATLEKLADLIFDELHRRLG